MVMNNGDVDESTDRADEIITDIISLVHSTTQTSYVNCSQLSSRMISYFSEVNIQPSEWKDLTKAIEVRFCCLLFFSLLLFSLFYFNNEIRKSF